MKQFLIFLKNEKQKQYFLIAFLFVLINFSVFLYFGITAPTKELRISFLVRAGVILACLAIDQLLKNSKRSEKRPYMYVAMWLITFSWFKEDYWMVFGICLLVSLLFLTTYRELLLKIDTTKIVYPSFPEKKIEWNRLNNVILKDGLLTIDFKNNKLIQQVIDEQKTKVDEKEFNEFCKEQLKIKTHN